MWIPGVSVLFCSCFLFFFNDTATTEIYTLSLHDALPICFVHVCLENASARSNWIWRRRSEEHTSELQSRGLISYAVFCLKKKADVSVVGAGVCGAGAAAAVVT